MSCRSHSAQCCEWMRAGPERDTADSVETSPHAQEPEVVPHWGAHAGAGHQLSRGGGWRTRLKGIPALKAESQEPPRRLGLCVQAARW